MNLLRTALLGALLACSAGYGQEKAGQEAPAPAGAESAEEEYRKLLEKDEAALQQYEQIMREANAFRAQGAPIPEGILRGRIERAFEPVQKAYEEFLERHPKHVDGRIAFGSFLQEMGDEPSAIEHLEKARELAPDNPTPWNNLANIYGHIGPVRKAFHYYHKAIELDPTEPVYVHNLATTTYLFRKDAMEMFRISEDEVFDKALELYRQAMKLDPGNFLLATDYAQSFYGIRPMRLKEALAAWEHALTLAKGDLEKEGIYLHLARVELTNGLFEEAEKHLDLVKHPDLQQLKERLQRNLAKKRAEAAGEGKDVKKESEPGKARDAE